MRIRKLAPLPLLTLAIGAQGQSAGLGVKGGVLASTTMAANIRTSPVAGATAGLYLPWGVGPRIELQPEILLSALGAHYTEPDGDEYTIRSMYVQLPLALKLFVSNTFHFSGGYQFGKLLQAQRLVESNTSNVTHQYNSLDMGFVAGLGVDLTSGVDINLRGYSAMTPSLRGDDALFPRNRALQLTVGYRFVHFSSKGKFHRRN